MLRFPRLFIAVTIWYVSITLAPNGHSQVQSPPQLPSTGEQTKGPAEPADADWSKKRQEIEQRLQQAQKIIDEANSSEPSEGPSKRLLTEIEMLKYLDLVYAQQQSAAELAEELAEEDRALQDDLERLRDAGPQEPRPYSFLLLDELRDELSAEQARKESSEAEVDTSQRLLESIRHTREDAERQRRLAKDNLPANRNADANAELTDSYELAVLYCEVVGEAEKLKLAEIANSKRRSQLNDRRLIYLQEKVDAVAPHVTFSQQDLDQRLALLQEVEDEIQQEMRNLQTNLKSAEQQWWQARQRQSQASEQDEVLDEQLTAWRLTQDVCKQEVSLLNQDLSDLVTHRYVWGQRFQIINGTATTQQLFDWKRKSVDATERILRAKELVNIQMKEARLDLMEDEKRLRIARSQDAPTAAWIEHQLQQRQRLVNALGSRLVRIDFAERLVKKLVSELGDDVKPKTATDWLAITGQTAKTAWNYEIVAIDDQPITVRKIVGGLVLLLFGYYVSRWLSRLVGGRLLPRFGMDEGVASALQTIAFYFLLAMFGFVTLEVINLPVTVFAFMGGAIAIGVGFGSQNILNNFISGLILLAERPIRVGDLVEVDGMHANIEHIGARSTRVKTGSNLEIIVPNSKFLENNVTNLTLSDTRIRTSVAIGVAYGSPTRTVTKLLQEAVQANPNVLLQPEPITLFRDFGDNALHFEVHFWIQMRTVMQRLRVESEIRHTIDEMCAEANITIAFPQRDIHLDTIRPIEITLRDTSNQSADLPSQMRRAA
jgi:small-conductance mechanosensitive channel